MRLLRRQKGAVFIDVMMGIYLLVILVFAFAATMSAAVISRAIADQRTKAAALVSRQLESVKAAGYGGLTYDGLRYFGLVENEPARPPYRFSNVGASSERVSNILPSGSGTVDVSDVSGSMRMVTVAVSWTGPNGRTRTVIASTKIARLK